jgi:hypothetical protein
MSSRPRWLAGLALLLGAAGAIGVTRLFPAAAEAGRPAALPGVTACGLPPAVGAGRAAVPGTFYKLQAQIDTAGVWTGQHLTIGAAGQARAGLDLPAESSASGPHQGVVVVTSDDGSRSTLRLLAVARACAATAYATDSVIRHAILDQADGSVLFHMVSRGARTDLGVWRLAAGAATATRLVDALPATLGLGQVWATDLQLDPTGRLLAVQSCLDRGCLTRIVDLGAPSLPAMVVRGGRQGPLLGFAGNRLITWAACDGFPCAVLAWDPASAAPTELVAAATAAGLTAEGRLLVAMSTDGSAEHPLVVDLTTGAVRGLHGLAPGDRPIAVGGLAGAGLELAPDQLAVAQRAGDAHAVRPSSAGEVLP